MTNLTRTTETDSDWIGYIPEDWSLVKLKYIFSEKKSTSNSDLQCGSISFGKVIFKNDDKVPDSTKQSYQEVLEGEFLINPLNLNFDLKSLRIGLSKISVVVSQGYIVLKINDGYLPSYYEYLLRKFDVEHMKSLGQGVRQTISFTHIKDEKLVVPPSGEQQLISRYLEKKTSQIDLIVEKLKKKTNLIKEGILSYHYECEIRKTRLNPHPTCWFQRIPEDWDIVKFRQLFEPVSIKNNSTDERLLSVTQDKGVVFRDEQERDVVNPGGDTSSYKLVTPGDVIISLRSADGGLEVSDVRGLVSPAYIVLKPKFKYDRNFYRYLLTSKNFVVELNRYIKGIRDGKNIYFDDIKDVLIPYFPIDRHNESYQKVVSHHENLVESFSKIEKKISYLNEYRRSLISSVVTGKIRVTEDMI